MRILSFVLFVACRTEKPISEPSNDGDVVLDEDGDGYTIDEDCDDGDASIHPNAVEVCDSIDNNCDGQVDEGVTIDFYLDNDGDGFGHESDVIQACEIPSGYAFNGTDCDDEEPSAFPGNPEICDGLDNDCNELTDDEDANLDLNTATSLYVDNDGDGFGDASTLVLACSEGEGQVLNGDDCNDGDAAIHPEAQEICDGIDNDCDELLDLDDDSIDENSGGLFYADTDGDGFGDESSLVVTCDAPEGYVANLDDCNDGDASIHPEAQEICDEIDNDCDLQVDDEDSSLDATTGSVYYSDADGDGFGDAQSPMYFCSDPGYGYSDSDTDCEDGEEYTYPGAAYQEGEDCLSDFDGDGYAPQSQGGLDCDDNDPIILPTNSDIVGDFIDQNCDGIDGTDMDGDGYASQASGGEDCDDNDPSLADNCPPEWGSVEISGTPYSTEDLTCIASASDPDGDSLSYSYVWIEGVFGIGTTQTLTAGSLQVGDTVQCCAVASDGVLDTAEQCSDVIEIENQLPVVDGYALSASSIYTDDTLSVSVTLSDMDSSQQSSLSALYDWHVVDANTGADTLVQSGSGSSLDGSVYFDRDDEVYVIITPTDGVDDGSSVTSNGVVVFNTPPTTPTISISPSSAVQGEDDLTCTIDVESQDADGDSVLYTYTWTDPDGVVQQTTTQTSSLSDVFLATGTTEGTWVCDVVSDDGIDLSSSVMEEVEVESICSPSTSTLTTVDSTLATIAPNSIWGPSQITAEWWFNFHDITINDQMAVSTAWDDSYTGGWFCNATPTGVNFNARYATPSASLEYSYDFNQDQWYHVACTYDGTEIQIFINGKKVGSHTYTGGLEYNNSNLILFHRNKWVSNTPKNYSVRDIRISNAAKYSVDFVPDWDISVQSNTIALFEANEGSGASIESTVGNYSATLSGTYSWGVSGEFCDFIDEDGDGVAAWEDCDDTDSNMGSFLDDADCNGITDLVATDVSNGTPLGVYGSAMAYDPNSGTVILFGGEYQSYGVESNETWSWDGNSWTQLSPSTSPPRRRFGSMAYDSTLGGLVLFGGKQYDGSYHGYYLNDTWLWDGSNWQQLSSSVSPSARSVDLVENPGGGVFLHGGQAGKDGCCIKSDSFVFANGQWTEVTTSGGPGSIQGHQMVYDSTNDQVLLFQTTDTMYHWNGSSWSTSQSTAYPTLSHTNMVFDKNRGAAVLTCGIENNSRSNDVWVWYDEEWSQQTTSSLLPVRNTPNLAYDDQNGNIILYAGQEGWSNGGVYHNDTWILE